MNKYEILYIISGSADEVTRDALTEKFKDYVITTGGTVDNIEKWGLKKFAYPVNYKNEGYYVLMNFTCSAGVPAEMQKLMQITENLVRSMCVRKD
ncbi:MAG: 30S ribosomal protein S6 [Clostridia bacterium]|jgi:small subunit ribosomal protein S6|nr:30S ribosomal protein S6 [Clostridia bacterium]MDD4275523.1 30S ribosomal protein S6 [Clostridia bacterium]